MSTKKQLRERWLTPEGKKVRRQIIEHIKEPDWEKHLKGFDFIKEVSSGKDLRYIDLVEVDLSNSYLDKTDFSGANLKKANFEGSNLWETIFYKADLTEANLSRTSFREADFKNAILEKANLNKTNLFEDTLEEGFDKAYLKGPDFVGADFKNVDFERADLSEANLSNCNLGECYFEGVNLSGTDFQETYFVKSNLSGVNLKDSNFDGADFKGATINGDNFMARELVNAKLRTGKYKIGFDYTDTNGQELHPSKSFIIESDLNGASFKRTSFVECTLNNIKFNNNLFDNVSFNSSVLINIEWGNSRIKKEYFLNLKPKDLKKDYKDYISLSETYLSIKNQFNKNGRYIDMSWAYLKEKESLRLEYKQNIIYKEIFNFFGRTKNFFKFIWEYFLFILFGYGEKPWHILGWSIFTIIVFGIVYRIIPAIGSGLKDIETTINFWRSLYFSAITFTTVGFGDFHPINDLSRILVVIEAALGLFCYSLFIFTFGRRIAGR